MLLAIPWKREIIKFLQGYIWVISEAERNGLLALKAVSGLYRFDLEILPHRGYSSHTTAVTVRWPWNNIMLFIYYFYFLELEQDCYEEKLSPVMKMLTEGIIKPSKD